MYDYFKGKIIFVANDYIVIEVNNIGFKILVVDNDYKINDFVKVYLYYYFSDNIKLLYGFKSYIEREVFNKFINLKNIGIKTAFNILKNDKYDLIINAALNKNYDFLLSLNKINETNVEQLIKSLSSINYSKKIDIDKIYYVTLKELDYKDEQIYNSYKKLNPNLPINIKIKEGIRLIESGEIR